ncbi:MAG: hypothetical protein ACYTG6_01625 [Planctomycetota bacterium]|jgi:Fe-S-cluster containining protein
MQDVATTQDQFAICTQDCGARCCRYITVGIATPRAENDWDEIRWWLAHEGSMVTKDEDGWMLHVQTPCRHLQSDHACAIYPRHMITCKEYDPENCEFTGDVPYEVQLHREADLADYLERRGLKRGARVAQAIREAARRPAPSRLVPLQGLAP